MNLLEGQVVNNIDPQEMGRLLVVIPEALGGINQATWARACLPARTFQLPSIGEFVWVTQLAPDAKEFVWLGHSPHKSVENYTQNIAERNGEAPEMELKQLIKSSPILSVVEKKRADKSTVPRAATCPDRHTLVKTPGGITFFADNNVLNKRYATVKNPVDLRKAMHAVITEKDDIHWGIEDPIGNKVVLEHLDGNTYMTVAVREGTSKEMSLVFNTRTQEILVKDFNQNSILMSKDKILLTAKGGEGDILIKGVNSDGEEPMILGNQLKTLLDKLYDALNTWIPIPSDGGAALKAKLADFLASYASYEASGAYLTKKAG